VRVVGSPIDINVNEGRTPVDIAFACKEGGWGAHDVTGTWGE